jgi:hypothetical protein
MSDHHTKVSGGGGEAAVGGCNIGGAEKSVVSNTSGAETSKYIMSREDLTGTLLRQA